MSLTPSQVASTNGTGETTGIDCAALAISECHWYQNDCPNLAYKKHIKDSEFRECECFGTNHKDFYKCTYDYIHDNCNTDDNVKKMKKTLVEHCSAFDIVEMQVTEECAHYLKHCGKVPDDEAETCVCTNKHYPLCAAKVVGTNLPEYLDVYLWKWEQQCPVDN